MKPGRQGFSWASLPLIATVARLLHNALVRQREYLRVHYEVVRSRVPGRGRFTDDERWALIPVKRTRGNGGEMREGGRAEGSRESRQRLKPRTTTRTAPHTS